MGPSHVMFEKCCRAGRNDFRQRLPGLWRGGRGVSRPFGALDHRTGPLSHTHKHTDTPSHTHTHTLSLSLYLTHTPSHTLLLSFSHTHCLSLLSLVHSERWIIAPVHSPSLTHTHTHTLSLTLYLSLSSTHSHTHTLSRSLSLSHTQTRLSCIRSAGSSRRSTPPLHLKTPLYTQLLHLKVIA